jgi:hypothetical protein
VATPISLVYLDVDDEITSAANRIRKVTEMRVALILPAGSRLATSRINFRLLAREAQSHAHDLYIVAPEAATRALAASAGLAVYPTVRDLEGALESGELTGSGADAPVAPGEGDRPQDLGPASRRGDMARPVGERITSRAESSLGPGAAESGGSVERSRRDLTGRSAAADLPVVSGVGRWSDGQRRWLVPLAAIVVVAFIGGFAGAQILPAATIVVTPRVEPLELTFNVTADPTASVPDLTAAIVPATQPEIPLEASGDFRATGKKVNETKATGTVTFSSLDTGRANTIPAGSIVATQSNTQFVTKDAVILPPAKLVGTGPPYGTVPSTGDTTVTAVKPGTASNVAAGAIKIVPSGENPVVTNVTNQAPTSGGTHTETLIVSQKDIDDALATLTGNLDASLDQIVTEPGQILPDVTVFPGTKSRTDPVLSIDPATLLGAQVESFSLSATATGTVTAVDEAAVSALATARIRATVAQGRDLVKDSVTVSVGKGTARGADIVFPVHATAQQVRRVVAADLVAAVRGRPLAEARAALEAYGTTTIDLWPGFVSSIPNYDFRIDLTVRGGVAVEEGSPGPGSSGASPTPRPPASATPRASPSPSPKPSPTSSVKPSARPSAATSPSPAP